MKLYVCIYLGVCFHLGVFSALVFQSFENIQLKLLIILMIPQRPLLREIIRKKYEIAESKIRRNKLLLKFLICLPEMKLEDSSCGILSNKGSQFCQFGLNQNCKKEKIKMTLSKEDKLFVQLPLKKFSGYSIGPNSSNSSNLSLP